MANIYIGSLIDFDRSILMYPKRWTIIQEQIAVGTKSFFISFIL